MRSIQLNLCSPDLLTYTSLLPCSGNPVLSPSLPDWGLEPLSGSCRSLTPGEMQSVSNCRGHMEAHRCHSVTPTETCLLLSPTYKGQPLWAFTVFQIKGKFSILLWSFGHLSSQSTGPGAEVTPSFVASFLPHRPMPPSSEPVRGQASSQNNTFWYASGYLMATRSGSSWQESC